MRGVARRLEQVFVNVYLNAAQAFPDEPNEAHDLGPGEGDRGHGRGRSHGQRIGNATRRLGTDFEPFFTMRPTGTGTGLGLFICKDILLRAGGSIRAESEVGRGTTVTITLQRAEPAAACEVPPVSTTRVSGRRILVVDDEPLIVSTIVRALGRDNVVVGETSPERALVLAFADPPFDVIVCDVMMEGSPESTSTSGSPASVQGWKCASCSSAEEPIPHGRGRSSPVCPIAALPSLSRPKGYRRSWRWWPRADGPGRCLTALARSPVAKRG